MNMIWHDNEGIKQDVLIVPEKVIPTISYNRTERVVIHDAIYNFAKQISAVESTCCHEALASLRVVCPFNLIDFRR